MVGTSIANHVDQSVVGDIIYKPTYLIAVCFEDYFKLCFGIYRPDCSTVGIDEGFINVGSDIVQPDFLPRPFKSCRRRSIDQCFQKRYFGLTQERGLFFYILFCSSAGWSHMIYIIN